MILRIFRVFVRNIVKNLLFSFILDVCGANQLNIRRESHYNFGFDCIFCFVSKSWPVQTALGFSFSSLLRPLYQVPPPIHCSFMPQGLVIRAEGLIVKLRV